MTILSLKEIGFTINGYNLIDQITFDVEPGQITAVVGPNGAGKSTVLRTISGECSGATGSIEFCGKDMARWSSNEKARRMAVLPQFSSLSFPFTVREVVAMGRFPHSSGRKEDESIVKSAMAALDITHLRNRLYTRLSGGEKQRTQLARVMAQIWNPSDDMDRLLLLDEPTAFLDLGHQQQLMQAIRDFSRQGVAVLMVLHDINLATRHAHKVVALQQGRVVANGDSHTVVTEGLIQRLFGTELQVINHPVSGQPLIF
ncbi:heme ABC transporter ATP-binding protein [Teredinibacter haidensis]|uniref:heme ABC transporter ATP-binding protein n=1 Tax=Teredinibacter haidensis TaxID=2731755 RepID=UPI000948A459|nr:heme ABC transporter ATP-binding protein [Teredinibacter haidensis]